MTGSVRQRRWIGGVLLAACVASATATAPVAAAPAVPDGPTAAYVAVGPTRLADTRRVRCGCSRLDARTIAIDVAGRSDVPDDAVAAALTVTAVANPTDGFVTAYPGGTARPGTSTLNTRRDRVVANSTIVPLGTDGTIEVFALAGGEVIVDVTGVFVPAATSRSGRFVPTAPRRLADTRSAGAGLAPGAELTVPLPGGVPSDATALAVNVTALGERSAGHLTARRAGAPPTTNSFLNQDGTGRAVASSLILPVSPGGLAITAVAGGHLVVDVVGWFTGPSSPESASGLFVPVAPTRLLDTRVTKPRVWPGGTVELASPIGSSAALVTNLTVTRADRRGFVTAYPAGIARPTTSAINPGFHNHTIANLAITRASTRGVAYYSLGGTDLVVDLTGYFTGAPVAAQLPPPANEPVRSRVLMVGDSTLSTLNLYTSARSAFIGFDAFVDVDNCRRLVRPSCRSPVTGRIPNTILEAIQGTPFTFDILVVRAGYNDWNSDFPSEFDAVVRAARAKGAHTILWMSYTTAWSDSASALKAYRENNADLFRLVTLPHYGDVLVADLDAYTRSAPPDWTWDGAHLTEYGTWLVADFISRWVAAVDHRPCPKPWGPGGPSHDPCPKPELVGAVPDVTGLYP